MSTCAVEGCESPPYSRSWCVKHYRRWQNHGDPSVVLQIQGDDLARFQQKYVETPDGCWQWRNPGNNGYGAFTFGRKQTTAHRAALKVLRGITVPASMQVDHLCRNKACVNPDHLEVVTPRENTMRAEDAPAAINARKTHCLRGHPLSGDNLRINSRNDRVCRACTYDTNRRSRERRQSA